MYPCRSYVLVKLLCVVSPWAPALTIRVDVNTNEPLGPSGFSRPSSGPSAPSRPSSGPSAPQFSSPGDKGYSHTFVASPGVRKYNYGITHDPAGRDFSIDFNPLDTDVDMDNYVHEPRGFEPSDPEYRQSYVPDYDEIMLKVKPLTHKEMEKSSREIQGVHQEFGKRPLATTQSTLIIHAPKPIAFEEMDLGLMGYGDFMDSHEHDSNPTPQSALAYSPKPSPLYASPSPTGGFHNSVGPTAFVRTNFGSQPVQLGLGAYANGGTPKPLGLSAFSTPKPLASGYNTPKPLGFSTPQSLRVQPFGSYSLSTPKPSGLHGLSTPKPQYGFSTPNPEFPRGFSTPKPHFSYGLRAQKPQFSYGLSTPKPQFVHGLSSPKPHFAHGLSTPKPQFSHGLSTPKPQFAHGLSSPKPHYSNGFSTPKPQFPHGFSTPKPQYSHGFSTPKPLALNAHPSPTPIIYKPRPTPIRFQQQQPPLKFPQQGAKVQFPSYQDQRLVKDFKAPKLQYGFKPLKSQYLVNKPQLTKQFDENRLNNLADEAFSKVFMSHNHNQEMPMVYTQHNHVSNHASKEYVSSNNLNPDMNAYLVPVFLMPSNSEHIQYNDFVMNYHGGKL